MVKNKNNTNTVIIIIVVVILLILFIVSFGKIDGDGLKIPDELKDDKASAKSRHKRLKALIEKQESLKRKLDKKFKRIYFGVRLCLVFLWAVLMILLYYFGLIKELGDFINYSELSILCLITVNFITFGTITELKSYIEFIKTKTENWVFGKYVSIEENITKNKVELGILETQING